MIDFNISMVIYNTPVEEITRSISLFKKAGARNVYVIDNEKNSKLPDSILGDCVYIKNGSNIGYGRGHNIAMRKSINQEIDYHFVVNTDVKAESEELVKLLKICERNPEVGLASPKIVDELGNSQKSAKLLPTPWDLLCRLIFGQTIHMKIRPQFYLENVVTPKDGKFNCPYLSGCFMLFRVKALKEIGLFDEKFFMYPEDIDIGRRFAMSKTYSGVCIDEVEIFHAHRAASKKSLKLLLIHIHNIILYFNKWGWFVDKMRKKINQSALGISE